MLRSELCMLYFSTHSSIMLVVFFFFSSRRRHTRLQGDWSSDVCSSDLIDSSPLADRYFPELALAWRAVEQLRAPANGGARPGVAPALLDFDCIAVDE